jgi:hypothetical protein
MRIVYRTAMRRTPEIVDKRGGKLRHDRWRIGRSAQRRAKTSTSRAAARSVDRSGVFGLTEESVGDRSQEPALCASLAAADRRRGARRRVDWRMGFPRRPSPRPVRTLAWLGADRSGRRGQYLGRRDHAPRRRQSGAASLGDRNPIYLGTTVAFVGLGAAANSLWFAVAALFAAKLIEIVAIRREEAHLALLFGAQWTDYAARVPRWLGPSRRREASA